ncbi:MAG: hypothetical protein ACE5IL_12450 [Myxococcota bacterium]
MVVTSRCDDHGGDMLGRLTLFAEGLLEQAERHDLDGELIIVEWNPPAGPRLRDVLSLHRDCDHFPIRFIEVPEALHRQLLHSDTVPLFQMIAKNVGIRRARGRFILATNPDLLFTDALMRFLATGDIDPRGMYRIDRTDVDARVPTDTGIEEQLRWCAGHVLRVHTRWGSFPAHPVRDFVSGAVRWSAARPRRVWVRIGEMMAAARRAWRLDRRDRDDARQARWSLFWRTMRGWAVELGARALRASSRWRPRRHLVDPLRSACAHAHFALARAARVAQAVIGPGPRVHTNGCGDFTLLSREAWKELRGYAEFPIWSMHLDSLLCYSAVAAGYRQHILRSPARLYHIEHRSSWVTMGLDDRLRAVAGRPWLDSGLLAALWSEMRTLGRPIVVNDESWGYARHHLQESDYRSSRALPPRRADSRVG